MQGLRKGVRRGGFALPGLQKFRNTTRPGQGIASQAAGFRNPCRGFSAVAFLGIPLAHIFGIILGGIAIFLALYRREAYFSTIGFLLGLAGIGLGMVRMIMIILEG